MQNDLIYDIGMHNGDDTAFYLALGYRVLAVEADADLMPAIHARFKNEIETRRLTVLNVAIAAQNTTAEFWINDARPAMNSFNRESATRVGEPVHSRLVECRRLDGILSEYGIPHYLKIDIEGHDLVCCEQLTPETKPKYISVEMTRIELLLRLRDLGYNRFKLIMQHDLRPVELEEPNLSFYLVRSLYMAARDNLSDRSLFKRIRRASANKMFHMANALKNSIKRPPFRSRLLPEWTFIRGETNGSSGTFGEDLPGKWLTWNELAYVYHRDSRENERMNGGEFWCDLHATVH